MGVDDLLQQLIASSPQVREAVLVDAGGVRGASVDPARATALADAGAALLRAAGEVRGGGEVDRVSVTLSRGGLVTVSVGDRAAVVTTVAEPTVTQIVHDLRQLLGQAGAR